MTLVGPILMAALFVVPVWFATLDDESLKNIAVIDHTQSFEKTLNGNKNYKFIFIDDTPTDTVKSHFSESNYEALLYIPKNGEKLPITLYSDKQPSLNLKTYISERLENKLQSENLQKLGIRQSQIDSAKVDVKIETVKWQKNGKDEESSAEIAVVLGFLVAIVIYMFIFMYGAQVMRGVIEEKTGRIVEILISSVKPFELMAGKILGIALTAMTQFILWIVLTTAIIIPVKAIFTSNNPSQIQQITQQFNTQNIHAGKTGEIMEIFQAASHFNFISLGIAFVFFFIFGYLLYASLFAAIGSAVDSEADTQQFMLPVTVPLILAFVAAQSIIRFPDGNIAFWFSVIPYTSPIIMPIRIAAEAVSVWEIVLSGFLLIAFFILHIWIASKIYRTGILMYGKKPSYREIWKWLKYK
jgi:ABC-2 type transport system permease protein